MNKIKMDTKNLPANIKAALRRSSKDCTKIYLLNTLHDILRLAYIDKMVRKIELRMKDDDTLIENFCLENINLAKSIGISPSRFLPWSSYKGLHILDAKK